MNRYRNSVSSSSFKVIHHYVYSSELRRAKVPKDLREIVPSADTVGDLVNQLELAEGRRKGSNNGFFLYPEETQNGLGFGLKAAVEIKNGTEITKCFGIVSKKKPSHNHGAYVMQLSQKLGWYVDTSKTGSLARFLNHSCNPNCQAQAGDDQNGMPVLTIRALHHIPANVWLTIDYTGGCSSRESRFPRGCLCGENNCRYPPSKCRTSK